VGIPANPDLNGASQHGVALSQVTQHRGRRASTAHAFLKPIRRRKNLTVLTGAQATRIVLDGERAIGVEYRHHGRIENAHARDVILSGGAINSPQLLMLSGIGPRRERERLGIPVARELPAVGRHLQDHLSVPVIATIRTDRSLLAAERPSELAKYLLTRKGMLTSNVGEAMAFVRSAPDLDAPDLQLIFAPVEFIEHGLEPPPGHGVTCGVVLLQPQSEGEVVLDSIDPFQPARIEPRYLSDPGGADLEVLARGVEMAREILRAPALASSVEAEMWPGADVWSADGIHEFVRRRAETLYHPVGTCRMGPDPTDAVVDPRLQVHGIGGLRVVDASVMPRIVRGNTNAPTIMIAERAAAMIAAVPSKAGRI
jgi:choline dehydrogenase